MLPEPLHWEYFRGRRYEMSLPSEFYHCPYAHQISGGGGYSVVMGIDGGRPRWRERHLHPYPDPYPYQYPSPRWVSDFRSRTGPPGYVEQGSPHLYPEDGGHRFVQSHPNDRFLEDERYRSSGSGRRTRFTWKRKPSFNLKDKKGSLCKASPSLNDPGSPNDVGDKQKSVDDVLTHNSSPHSNLSYSCNHSQPKDQTEENDSLDAPVNSSQELEIISSSVSNDCKMEVEAEQGNDTLLPPPGNADNPVAATYAPAASETYTASSEEIHCCKRRRLGWGEGLAKYENKKIEHTDDSMAKSDMLICSNSGEHMHVLASNVIDEITGASSLTECPSPARQFSLSYNYSPVTKEKQLMSGSITPDKTNLIVSSATKEKQLMIAGSLDHDKSNLSLPPAIQEKQLMTARSIDHDKANLSLSPVAEEQQLKTDGSINHDKDNLSVIPGSMSQNHVEGSNFKLKNLEPFAINGFPQSDSLSAVDSDFVKSTAIDELPSWKNDILKAIELTESEINKLECQLELVSVPEIVHNQPTSLSFPPVDCILKPSHIQTTDTNFTCQTASLEIVLDQKMPCAEEVLAADVNYGDVDASSSGKGASSNPENQVQRQLTTEDFGYACVDANSNFEGLSGDKAADFSVFNGSQSNNVNPLSDEKDEDKLCEVILASNRDSAIRAAEVFNKLLPANNCNSYIPPAIDNSVMIKARLLRRKLLLRFKERIVALKFRVFQHFWKQDVHLLSMTRFLVKGQKKTNRSLRPVHSGFNKYRLSLRSRVAGRTGLIADTEMINFVGKLISNNLVKPLRKDLKMPALIFDEKEKVVSKFVSTNGLVEDPMAVEKEMSLLNPWTEEEKAMFMDKLSTSGKDFMKIASFFDHKTTADCIEFYYKNHKSEWFKRPVKVEKDSSTNNYLIASGKQLMPDGNTASLDILGSATAITTIADNDIEIQHQCMSNYFLDTTGCKISRDSSCSLERSDCPDLENSEKETLAADVLPGTCGSLSLEPLNSSCITSVIDPREVYYEQKYQEKCASSRFPSTTEVSQSFGVETCSGESLEDMDDSDWTDAEKFIFIQGMSSYGKDFCMISRYMKTRSMDQCRLFFSKARKCASLNKPGSGNTVSDANAACSDTHGTSAVANPVAFCVKSGIETEGCLLSPRMIISHECDAVPMLNARTVLKSSEQSAGTSDLEPVDSKYHLDNLTEIQQVEKSEHTLGMDNMGHGIKMMDLQCGSTLVIPSHIQAVDNIHNGNNLSDQLDCQSVEKLSSDLTGQLIDLSDINVNENSEKDALDHDTNFNQQVEKPEQALGIDGMGHGSNNMDLQCESTLVIPSDLGAVDTIRNADHLSDQSDCESVERPSSHLTGRELDLSETNVNEDSQKDVVDAMNESSSDHHMELKMHSAQSDDIASTSGCHDTAGSLQVELCSDSLEESCFISLKQNNAPVPMILDREVFVDAKCKKTSQEGKSSLAIDVKKNDEQDQVSRLGQLYPSGYFLMDDSAACSKISEGHAVSVSTAREMNDDTSSKKLVTAPSISRYDRNFHLPPGGSFLKKCNGTKENCSMAEFPIPCVEQSRDSNPCSQSDASSGKDKPHQSGKLKLFGQILRKPTLQQKQSVIVAQHKTSEIQHEAGKSSSVKLTADLSVGGSSALENSDSNNLLDSRIQAGFPSLAKSGMPHSRYHQAFSSCLSSKMEHPRFLEINAGNRNLDGLSRFSARKMCSSNRVMNYQVVRSREVRSFTVDMEQQPEVLFPKRRNGLEVGSGVQNAERGTVGIKRGRNSSIVVGGQHSAFSVPLAARKMHYMQPNYSAFSDSTAAMKRYYMQSKHSVFSDQAMNMHYMQPKHSAFSNHVAAMKLHYMQPKHSALSDQVAGMDMHYIQPKHSSFSDPVAGTRILYMQCKRSSFPDPVTAAKMQYMQRKQFNGHTGSMMRG